MKIVKGPRAKTCIHIYSALSFALLAFVSVTAVLLGIWTTDDRWLLTGATIGSVGFLFGLGTGISFNNHNHRCEKPLSLPWRAQPEDAR